MAEPRPPFQPPSTSEAAALLKQWQTEDLRRSSIRIIGRPEYPIDLADMRRDDTALAFLERLVEKIDYLYDDGQMEACVGLASCVLHRLVQQNHDGLPQKAGVQQELMNEIHGSWFDRKR